MNELTLVIVTGETVTVWAMVLASLVAKSVDLEVKMFVTFAGGTGIWRLARIKDLSEIL
jgi:peroxiredoxin family protein